MLFPPLTKAHVNPLSGLAEPAGGPGEEEIERRAQELWAEWLSRYFTGTSFDTADGSGGLEAKTFAHCAIRFDSATLPVVQAKPLLHVLLADRRDREPERQGGGRWAHDARFVWNLLVRTHPSQPAAPGSPPPDGAAIHAERQCRRLADQLRWLLTSYEAQALSAKGILELRVENGPREIPAGAWFLRQLVVSARIRWETPNHEPAS